MTHFLILGNDPIFKGVMETLGICFDRGGPIESATMMCSMFCIRPSSFARSPSSARLPFSFLGEGPPTKIDYRKKGAPILSSLPEDLVWVCSLVLSL